MTNTIIIFKKRKDIQKIQKRNIDEFGKISQKTKIGFKRKTIG